jgi:hypothetical protein
MSISSEDQFQRVARRCYCRISAANYSACASAVQTQNTLQRLKQNLHHAIEPAPCIADELLENFVRH